MIKIQLLTMVGCGHCAEAKKILDELKQDYELLDVEEVDITTDKGQEMIAKYSVMSSPGVIVNGELFSQGGLEKEKLVDRIKTLQSKS